MATRAGAKLLTRIKRWRGAFVTFLHDRNDPVTNNGSEPALHPNVIFRKVTKAHGEDGNPIQTLSHSIEVLCRRRVSRRTNMLSLCQRHQIWIVSLYV